MQEYDPIQNRFAQLENRQAILEASMLDLRAAVRNIAIELQRIIDEGDAGEEGGPMEPGSTKRPAPMRPMVKAEPPITAPESLARDAMYQ